MGKDIDRNCSMQPTLKINNITKILIGCRLVHLFIARSFILGHLSLRASILVNILSTEKLEIELDADLMTKLKTKADTANKTPSETIAEILREQLK